MGKFRNRASRGVISDFLSSFFSKRKLKVSLVMPAYNEEKTIGYVIKQAKLVREIAEIIVVDDGSKDKTAKIAEGFGVKVIKHHKNLGKGEAIKTGIEYSKEQIILFLDADLKDITDKKIKALIIPILRNKADFTKASFNLERGRVTEFAVKPMMNVLYPDSKFKQPISGQFAGKKDFLKSLKIEPRWGIDISILLDAIKHGQRVVEINLGELKHKARTTQEKSIMSQEVIETILKKAGLLCSKHKIFFFSNNTLFTKGFEEDSELFLDNLTNKRIKIVFLTTKKVKEKDEKYFTEIRIIEPNLSAKEILRISQRIAKKYDSRLKECVLFANKNGFENLAKEVDKSFCFNKSPEKLKEKCKRVHSLADSLLYLE